MFFFFFSSRRRHTRSDRDWSSDVCSSDLVDFFSSGEEASAAGYRACLRCKPDEVGRDREAVAAAVKLIEEAEETPSLSDLAAAVAYAPHHFQRLFKRDLGVSPAEYARAVRK